MEKHQVCFQEEEASTVARKQIFDWTGDCGTESQKYMQSYPLSKKYTRTVRPLLFLISWIATEQQVNGLCANVACCSCKRVKLLQAAVPPNEEHENLLACQEKQHT